MSQSHWSTPMSDSVESTFVEMADFATKGQRTYGADICVTPTRKKLSLIRGNGIRNRFFAVRGRCIRISLESCRRKRIFRLVYWLHLVAKFL